MKAVALAMATFKEAIRKKVLLVLLVFAFIFIGSSLLFTYFSGGEEIRMVKDVGLTGMLVFGLLIATFLGMSLIPTEIEKRIIYTILSKPVRRLEVVVGKYLGAALAVLIMVLLMGLVFMGLVFFKEHTLSLITALAIILTFFELLVVLAMAVTFSTFTSSTLSVVLTIFFYILGSSSDSLQYLGGRSDSPLLKAAVKGFGYLIPNFEVFNIRSQVLHNEAVPWVYIFKAMIYGLLLSAALLIVAGMFFQEKEV
ncbi:MAG: ABC transporter permease subunit [bacterium]|nr:ABC transporter permease subunit [bacterium]MDD4557878.1 ABC transporter permease subunit [bacterium]